MKVRRLGQTFFAEVTEVDLAHRELAPVDDRVAQEPRARRIEDKDRDDVLVRDRCDAPREGTHDLHRLARGADFVAGPRRGACIAGPGQAFE